MGMNTHAFELSIKDDGVGFCVAEAERTDRNGLRNMRARLAEIGGAIDVKSSAGETIVRVTLPVSAPVHSKSPSDS
jgi:signal transduction histidine kinase